jgi:phage-related protein
MADNANKMGTSLQSLQNAYTGFSRGNFTMLDNLALGFSGTKEGMEELLATAKELTGIDYNIDSYADIVQAIHAVQEEMEITGTTAKEAAGTISGSVASAGAAWDNFLTGVADGNADLEQLTDNLVDSVFTVADNILPRIGQAVDGIVTSFGRLLGFDLSGVAEKVSAFGNNVVTVSKNIMSAFKEGGVFGVFGEITEMIQTVVGVDLSWISEKFNILGTAIRNVQDAFMEGGVDGGLSAFVREFAGLTGVDISGIVDGVKGFIGAVSGAAPEVIDSVGRAIDAVLAPFQTPDAQAVIDKISDSIHAFVGWIEEADFTWIVSVGEGIGKLIEPIVTAAPEVIENVKNGLRDFFGVIFGADGVSLKGIVDSVVDLFSPITSAVADSLTTISEKFADIMKYAKESGSQVIITEDVSAVVGADCIYTDVWCSMGEEDKAQERLLLLKPYQVNEDLVAKTGKDNTVVLHCLPAVKGNEITVEVFDRFADVIFDEAENRMHTIKAVMVATLGKQE